MLGSPCDVLRLVSSQIDVALSYPRADSGPRLVRDGILGGRGYLFFRSRAALRSHSPEGRLRTGPHSKPLFTSSRHD